MDIKPNLRPISGRYGVTVVALCDWLKVTRTHFYDNGRWSEAWHVELEFEKACLKYAIERDTKKLAEDQTRITNMQDKLKEKLAI